MKFWFGNENFLRSSTKINFVKNGKALLPKNYSD